MNATNRSLTTILLFLCSLVTFFMAVARAEEDAIATSYVVLDADCLNSKVDRGRGDEVDHFSRHYSDNSSRLMQRMDNLLGVLLTCRVEVERAFNHERRIEILEHAKEYRRPWINGIQNSVDEQSKLIDIMRERIEALERRLASLEQR